MFYEVGRCMWMVNTNVFTISNFGATRRFMHGSKFLKNSL